MQDTLQINKKDTSLIVVPDIQVYHFLKENSILNGNLTIDQTETGKYDQYRLN